MRPLGPISLAGQTRRELQGREGRGQPGELARLRWGGEVGLAACTAKDKLLRTPVFSCRGWWVTGIHLVSDLRPSECC